MNALAPLDDFTLDELDEALALADQFRSYGSFARAFWEVAQPGRPVVWGWHLDYVCERIQAHLDRGWGTFVVCMPVRGGKSTLVNVLAQAWDWLHRPSRQWANISKSDLNASRDSRRTRKVLMSAQFQRLARLVGVIAALTMEADQNQKRSYVNAAGGGRQCVTTEGSITGADVDVLVVDDAMDAKEVEVATPSQVLARCAEVVDRFDNIWTDRFTPNPDVLDHEPGVRLVVAQRLADHDLSGTLMARKRAGGVDIEVVVIPEVMDRAHPDAEFFAPCDLRADGEFLNPRLRGEALREAVLARPGGARKWSTRYDQRPVPKEGGPIQRSMFATRYAGTPEAKARECADLIITVDPAGIGETIGEDYTVMQVWGRIGEYLHLIDESRGRWAINASSSKFAELVAKWPKAKVRLVENTANGMDIIKRARAAGLAIVPVSTGGKDKATRAHDFVAACEAGMVLLPSAGVAPWVDAVIDEWCGFQVGGARDDRVDAAAYAAMHFDRKSNTVRLTGIRGL